MKKFLAMMLGVTVVLSGCGSSEKVDSSNTTASDKQYENPELILRYSETNAQSDERALAAEEFAQIINEETNGRIEIQVFPGGQLGAQSDVFQNVQLGAIDICTFVPTLLPDMGVNVPYLRTLGIPFLFRDQDHALKAISGEVGDKIKADINGANANVMLLDFFIAGARNFYTKEPVKTLADFSGKKIRVQQNETYMDMITAFGGNPTPVDFSEVYSALQTNLVDGSENPIKGYLNNKHYEVAEHYTYSNHMVEPSAMFISELAWNRLTDEEKQIFEDAAIQVTDNFQQLTEEKEATQIAELEAAGVQFHTLEDYDKWVEAAQPLFDKFGKGYEEFIESIQSIQ